MDNNNLDKIKEIAEWGKANGKSEQEIMSAVMKYKQQEAPQSMRGTAPERDPMGQTAYDWTVGKAKETWGDIKETGQGIKRQAEGMAEATGRAQANFDDGRTSRLATAWDKSGSQMGHLAGMGLEVAKGIGKVALPQSAEDKIAEVHDATMDEAARYTEDYVKNNPQAQEMIKYYYSLSPDQQAYARGTMGALDGLFTATGFTATGQLTNDLRKAAMAGLKSRLEREASQVDPTDTKTFTERVGSIFPQLRQADPEVKTAASQYSKAIYESFIKDNTTVSNQVDELARIKGTSRDEMLEDWSTRGYVPAVKGELANFEAERVALKQERNRLWEQEIAPKVKAITDEFDADEIADFMKEAARGAYADELNISGVRGADYDKAVTKIDNIIKNYKNKYDTESFNAEQLREMQAEMNSVSNAFNREGWEVDAEEAVAQSIRRIFDDLDPEIAEANKRYGQLLQDEKIIDIIDNQTIDVGYLGNAAGRYAGTVGASFVGAGIATGAGGLVIAGIFASGGGRLVNWYLRNQRFNPKVKEQILNELRSNPPLLNAVKADLPPDEQKFLDGQLQAGQSQQGKTND